MTGNRASGRKPDLNRRRLAAALHAQGLTFAEVGRRLGITRQAAMHLVQSVPTRGVSSVACLTCRRRVPYCRGCCRSCWIKHCQAVANGGASGASPACQPGDDRLITDVYSLQLWCLAGPERWPVCDWFREPSGATTP
jgi:hypothetical protein